MIWVRSFSCQQKCIGRAKWGEIHRWVNWDWMEVQECRMSVMELCFWSFCVRLALSLLAVLIILFGLFLTDQISTLWDEISACSVCCENCAMIEMEFSLCNIFGFRQQNCSKSGRFWLNIFLVNADCSFTASDLSLKVVLDSFAATQLVATCYIVYKDKNSGETKAIRCIRVVTRDKRNNRLLSCRARWLSLWGRLNQMGSPAHTQVNSSGVIAVSSKTSKGYLCPTVPIMSFCLIHT